MRRLLVLAVGLAFLAGCGIVKVDVRAYRNAAYPPIQKKDTFLVVPLGDAPQSLLGNKIRVGVQAALVTNGYQFRQKIEDAKYVLAYKYQVGGASAGVYTSNVTGAVVAYPRYSRSMFLQVLTRDGSKWTPIWEGHAISTGSSSDIDKVSLHLLAALFQFFDKETEGQERIIFTDSNLP